MTARLEHANITVPDIDAAIEFLLTLEPGFRVRHDSGAAGDCLTAARLLPFETDA